MPRHTKLKAKGQRTRGRHKNFKSRETRAWNKLHKKGKTL